MPGDMGYLCMDHFSSKNTFDVYHGAPCLKKKKISKQTIKQLMIFDSLSRNIWHYDSPVISTDKTHRLIYR
jgi:hypothetical protein